MSLCVVKCVCVCLCESWLRCCAKLLSAGMLQVRKQPQGSAQGGGAEVVKDAQKASCRHQATVSASEVKGVSQSQ